MGSYSGSDKRLQYLFGAVSAIVESIANEYDSTQTYTIDSYVIYQNVLYKCTSAVINPEPFDDTKWSAVLIVNEMGGGGGGTTVIANPAGAATDTLNKLQVGATIYSVSGGGGGGSLSWKAPYVPPSYTFKNVGDKYTAVNTGLLNIYVNPSSSSQRIVFKVTNNGVTYSAAWANNGDQNMIVIPINAGDELQVTASSYVSSINLTEIGFNLL